jgi:hypothetical protein
MSVLDEITKRFDELIQEGRAAEAMPAQQHGLFLANSTQGWLTPIRK